MIGIVGLNTRTYSSSVLMKTAGWTRRGAGRGPPAGRRLDVGALERDAGGNAFELPDTGCHARFSPTAASSQSSVVGSPHQHVEAPHAGGAEVPKHESAELPAVELARLEEPHDIALVADLAGRELHGDEVRRRRHVERRRANLHGLAALVRHLHGLGEEGSEVAVMRARAVDELDVDVRVGDVDGDATTGTSRVVTPSLASQARIAVRSTRFTARSRFFVNSCSDSSGSHARRRAGRSGRPSCA